MILQQLFYNITAMNALFASAAWCAARPNRASIATLVLFAVIWPFANGVLEGQILVRINDAHGVTVSDLFSVGAVVLAVVQAVRLARDRRRGR